ncbi:MAG TPA: PilZ domain-containing protein [Baekduia sp.]|nr:PilZ domain-containing protein [Baekduia sp.]
MRRLRDFQIVGLETGGEDSAWRVVAVDGGEAVLEPRDPQLLSGLTLPAPATLSFDTPRHPVLLAGTIEAGPIDGTLGFRVTDDVGVRPLRLRPRLKAELAVCVTPLDREGRRVAFAADHATTDVSAGGIRIVALSAMPGALLGLELAVPGLPEPLVCTGRVVRRAPDGTVAVAFTDLDPAVAETLDRLIFGVRQRVARQAFTLRESA